MQIIKRELYLSQIIKYYYIDLIKVLTGIRRCGKSFIINQIMEELKTQNSEDHIIYMNFEDFEFEEIDTAKKLHEYIKPKIKDINKYYLFFKDASPKYVLSLDKIDLSHDGITHISIEDFLLHKKDLFLA